MTVFEDLIVELKEENLLEDTVITVGSSADGGFFAPVHEEHDFAELIDSASALEDDSRENGAAIVGADAAAPKARQSSAAHKFAVDQVATFQMVEHVIASIERSRLNCETRGFDELGIKKALHKFKQAAADPSSMEFVEAEAELVHEVAVWQKNLAGRDADISVPVMRQYCETCQPALSAQALFSLARFYRSLPYSEFSRGKFEFLVTRLFSRRTEGERRSAICSKEEMLGHLKSRFKDPSDSYSNISNDDPDAVLAVLTFDDFGAEVEKASNVDALIAVNFFTRVSQFKESAGKSFFAPTVTAAAILSNIAIGNKLSDFLNAERKANRSSALLEEYGGLYDESISNAVGRTLTLEGLLRVIPADEVEQAADHPVENREVYREVIDIKKDAPVRGVAERNPKRSRFGISGVSRWLIAATIASVVISVGLFVWANYYVDSTPVSVNVKAIDLSTTQFKDVIKEARQNGDTFYGITSPAWDGLTKEGQQDVLTRLLKFGAEKGFKRVSLINTKGQAVGYAVEGRTDVFRL
jgi:hypothetical protein